MMQAKILDPVDTTYLDRTLFNSLRSRQDRAFQDPQAGQVQLVSLARPVSWCIG